MLPALRRTSQRGRGSFPRGPSRPLPGQQHLRTTREGGSRKRTTPALQRAGTQEATREGTAVLRRCQCSRAAADPDERRREPDNAA